MNEAPNSSLWDSMHTKSRETSQTRMPQAADRAAVFWFGNTQRAAQISSKPAISDGMNSPLNLALVGFRMPA
jgi:hypothetical protein